MIFRFLSLFKQTMHACSGLLGFVCGASLPPVSIYPIFAINKLSLATPGGQFVIDLVVRPPERRGAGL